jgi:pimeloyl-ACP methyl ester carboxylesterase
MYCRFNGPLVLVFVLLTCPHRVWTAVVSNITRGASNTTVVTGLEEFTGADQLLAFERSLWTNGSVADEDFYRVPANTSCAPAGSLLKLQVNANASAYLLPPGLTISRFLYQTKTFNGSLIPASAYILWPYAARSQPDGYAVVAFAHGTCGVVAECAPSHWKNLCYDFAAPYSLALQGYVVVAADYAGLGVGKDAAGNPIVHPYTVSPSHADDVFYSVQAAQSAFKALSKQFVIVGQSQGGGTAWAAAQRQAVSPVQGYLGSVALAPVTNFIDTAGASGPADDFLWPGIIQAISTIFPEFDIGSVVTPAGIERLELLRKVQGCIVLQFPLFSDPTLIRPDWPSNFYVQAFQNLTGNGGRPIAEPLLVVQGDADVILPAPVASSWVNRTCELYPDSQLEYVTFPGAPHGIDYPSQSVWFRWIEQRFAGTEAVHGCRVSTQKSVRPLESYELGEPNFLLAPYGGFM